MKEINLEQKEFWNEKKGKIWVSLGPRIDDMFGPLGDEALRVLAPKKGENVLDIGCGTGIFSLALSPFVKNIKSIDISKGVIERARKNLSDATNVSVQIGDITSIPLKDSSVNKVLGYSVLQYLNDSNELLAALEEVYRLLEPGGKALLAANPEKDKQDIYFDKVSKGDLKIREKEIEFQKKLYWFERKEVVEIASSLGFSVTINNIHNRIWQSFYMFDIVLVKDN